MTIDAILSSPDDLQLPDRKFGSIHAKETLGKVPCPNEKINISPHAFKRYLALCRLPTSPLGLKVEASAHLTSLQSLDNPLKSAMEDKRELDVHESSSEALGDEAGQLNEIPNPKLSPDGIILIPQPSDDPDDPSVGCRLLLSRELSH